LLTRRKFLYSGALAAAGAAAIGADGYFESAHPELKEIEILLPRLPEAFDGFRIAQLSDFHYENRLAAVPIRKAIELVNNRRPDLIVLTGDFVTVPVLDLHRRTASRAARYAEPCARLLRQLRAAEGSFAVLGNHDAASDAMKVTSELAAHGIPVLRNRSIPIERGNARFWLAGIDDVLEGAADLDATVAGVPAGETIVLLAHEPDFADTVATKPVDLQLSGHSHGGQIWIPGIGAPWLPPLGRKYPRGIYQFGNLTLYTNIGIGTIRAPIRLNAPPEISLITLRSRAPQNRASQKNPNKL